MARSRTPPPLSDRKRVLADAHRRKSFGTPGSPADSDEVEAGLFYGGDNMDVEESPTTSATQDRRSRRSKEAAGGHSNGRIEPPQTPQRVENDLALPTWTPLALPSTSSNASETSEPPPSASASDSTLRHPVSSSSRQGPPRRPMRTYTSNARKQTQLQAFRPSQRSSSHISTDTPRHLSAEVMPAGLSARTSKASTSRAEGAQSNGGTSSVTPPRKRKRDKSSEHFASPHPVSETTHIRTTRASGSQRDKGKGKARDVSPDPLNIGSDRGDSIVHLRELSPEVPPPPEFGQSMDVDTDDVDHTPTSSKGRQRSAWLDTPRVLEPGMRYYVGKRPQPHPLSTQADMGKGRAYSPQQQKKRNRDRTRHHEDMHDDPIPTRDPTDQWVAALNAASAMNAQLMGLSPPRSSRGSAGAHALVAAVNAAGRNNARLNRLATANREKPDIHKRGGEQPDKAKDDHPRAMRRRTIAGPSIPRGPEPEKPDDDGGWYLDLDTFSWRRRSAPAHDDADAGPSARAAGALRSAAGPSSAAARGSHPTGPAPALAPPPAKRPRGHPRESAPALAAGEDRPKRPLGRPRKYPRLAPGEEPPKPGPGRPHRERVPTVFELARAIDSSPPQLPCAPVSLLDIQEPVTPTLLRRTHTLPPRPAAEESERSSPTLVAPPAPAVPQEMEGGGRDGPREGMGGGIMERAGQDNGKGRAHGPLGDADLAPSPFVAPGPPVAVAKPKAPFDVLTWRVPQEPRSSAKSVPPTTGAVLPTTVPTVAPNPAPRYPTSPPVVASSEQAAAQALFQQQPPSRSQSQASSQPSSQPSSQRAATPVRLQTHQELLAQNPGEFSQVTVVPRGPFYPRHPPAPFQEVVNNAVHQFDAGSGVPQSVPRAEAQRGGHQVGEGAAQPIATVRDPQPAVQHPQAAVQYLQQAHQQPGPAQNTPEALQPPTDPDAGDETEDDEDAVAPAAAGDLADDSAVPEYQTLADLARALVAYVDAHPRGQPPGPFFVGCCALLVDEKTRIAEPYARGVAGELRDALQRQGGWAFRSQADAMRASFVRGKRSVELSYGCACPYSPSAQYKWCGGAVHVGVREVQDLAAMYMGVKGVRISVRVEH